MARRTTDRRHWVNRHWVRAELCRPGRSEGGAAGCEKSLRAIIVTGASLRGWVGGVWGGGRGAD